MVASSNNSNTRSYAYTYVPPVLDRENEKLCFVLSSTQRTKYEMEMRRQVLNTTPTHHQDFFACCHGENWTSFVKLCKKQPQNCTWVSPRGQNILHFICQRRPTVESILTILQLVPDALMKQDVDGCLPIHMAMTNGAPHDVLSLLIQICPESVKTRNRWGYAPYEWIFERCLYELLAFDHISDNSSKAIVWNTIEVVMRALTVTVTVDHDHCPRNRTVLHMATEFDCSLNLLKAILHDFPWLTKERDDCGRVPLASAANAPADLVSAAFIKVLILSDPRTLLEYDNDGRCPLHLAIDSQRDWSGELKDMVESVPECIRAQDGLSSLYPFMLLATKDTASLKDIVDVMSLNVDIFNEY